MEEITGGLEPFADKGFREEADQEMEAEAPVTKIAPRFFPLGQWHWCHTMLQNPKWISGLPRVPTQLFHHPGTLLTLRQLLLSGDPRESTVVDRCLCVAQAAILLCGSEDHRYGPIVIALVPMSQ